ncbi:MULTISPECIES: hypothetical protein [Hyphomicrobiales]|uniref:hypothetical protein n=1 Tax=Hyphomicrobiales TaxID=356 RepID=UPI002119C550|nr:MULTISPECIES: hypothetical protein [Hyphomicrobiales]MCQ9147332.1 hypothetical protein [Ochrobactrum sp. BTU2]MDH1271538.1 hypothetical protein [Agrobacterium pusense]MDX4076602.1 hypothetical protein [Brucella sp. NBRC 113783]
MLNQNPSPADYKRAADMNIWAAKMMRLQGNDRAAEAHLNLADLYIKQELRRSANPNAGRDR